MRHGNSAKLFLTYSRLHLLNHIFAFFLQDQSVSFACKQALMRLIHKHWHGMGSSSPQCNTPTGEVAGGDDFDGEDDDADRADRTTPEEASGTDAEVPQEGEPPDVEAPEVTLFSTSEYDFAMQL